MKLATNIHRQSVSQSVS